MVTKIKSGFTIIEILMVIGIISFLSMSLLMTLNFGEAQRKGRDLKRMKDSAYLVNILEGYLNDDNSITGSSCLATGCRSDAITGRTCSNNWLEIDFCSYGQIVPLDPLNGKTGSCLSGGTKANPGVSQNCDMNYVVIVNGKDYEINVRQEAKSSVNNVLDDGGNSDNYAEVGSNLFLK